VRQLTDVPRLYRVIIQVADLDRAARFYERLLGGPGRRIAGASRHYFDCGDVILALLQPGNGETARPTPDHLYFAVEDVEGIHARAKALGALASGEIHGGSPAGAIATRPWGERSFYAADPFGNLLCFVDAATLFTGR
jgi:catechol 2,3-dioxygenase-like lactoylglutathione lyase family enzyme